MVWIETKILCLTISGVLTYLLNLLFRVSEITDLTILVWLLISFVFIIAAWKRYRHLLICDSSGSLTSSVHELVFVLGFIVSCAIAIKMTLSGSTFISGDFSGFVRLTSQFTQFRGPWTIGANSFEYVSADRIHLHRIPGPPYPQATHFIVAMTDHLFGVNNLAKSARIVTTSLVFVVIPYLLILLSQAFGMRNNNPESITFSLLFAVLLQFDMNSGQVPTGIGISLMIFLLVFSLTQASLRLQILSIILGAILLLFVHPSSTASLILIYFLAKEWDLTLLKQSLSKVRYLKTAFLVNFLFIFIVLIYYKPSLIDFFTWFFQSLYDSQTNLELDLGLNFDLIARAIKITSTNFLTFGDASLENIFAVFLLIICFGVFRVNLRQKVRVSEVLIALLLLSSFFGGLASFKGLAKILSLPWYSSPSRLVHIWTICVFYRTCRGTFPRPTNPVYLKIILCLALAVYTIKLIS